MGEFIAMTTMVRTMVVCDLFATITGARERGLSWHGGVETKARLNADGEWVGGGAHWVFQAYRFSWEDRQAGRGPQDIIRFEIPVEVADALAQTWANEHPEVLAECTQEWADEMREDARDHWLDDPED